MQPARTQGHDRSGRHRSDMVMADEMELDQKERKSIHLPSREISPTFSSGPDKSKRRREEIQKKI